MKSFIILVVLTVFCFSLTGCGDSIINSEGTYVPPDGPLVIPEEEEQEEVEEDLIVQENEGPVVGDGK